MPKNKLVVKEVDFFGDMLKAARDEHGIVWAGVPWLCKGMGLTKDQTRNERKKIQDDLVLSQGVKFHPLGTGNANKEVLCLQLDYVPLWLAKISITPTMRENNPELVEKLVNYQLKVKDVLAAAFLPSYWQQTRQQTKDNRLLETECIKEFVAYAKQQGSQHADRYYYHLTSLANKAAGITEGRDKAGIQQLNSLALIEHIISEVLKDSMGKGKPYKEIYLDCRKRIEQFKEIACLGCLEKNMPI
jgi:P22_AR N-terminal domain.